MNAKLRKTLILVAKLAVAAGLLTYLFVAKFHWYDYTAVINGREQLCQGLRSTVMAANAGLLAVSFVIFIIPVFFMAARWWYLMRLQQIRLGYWEAVRLTFLGQFFCYIVPGMVSGDLIKAYYVIKHTDRKAAAVVSIFLDRAMGLLGFAIVPLVVMALVIVSGGDRSRLGLPALAVGIVLAAMTLCLAVLLSRRFRHMLRLDKLMALSSFLHRHTAMVSQAADLYRRRPSALLGALGITFVGQGMFITAILLAGKALVPQIPWHHYVLYVPLIYIIAAVPITPGGLGVVEWAYCQFLVAGAVAKEPVLALALLARAAQMFCGLPGIAVAITGAKVPKIATMEAELGVDGNPAA
ncbi:hypothetical protein LCGC14_1743250 [marine sediment metagenome]|uniref:Flippase-like domain-containing protein n=1 Tax=marine sediment metagenome TaxID=412755 RepID=A0A0F9JLB9_9ZZZZ